MKKTSLILFVVSAIIAFSTMSCKKNNQQNNAQIQSIDTVEYICGIYNKDLACDYNLWMFENIETSFRSKFVEDLLKNVYGGKVKVYDQFAHLLSLKDVEANYNVIDSVYVPDPSDPNKEALIVTKNQIQPENISKILFREAWSYDSIKGEMHKTILDYALVEDAYTINPTNGEYMYKGYRVLFWVKCDQFNESNKQVLCPTYSYHHISTIDTLMEVPSRLFVSRNISQANKIDLGDFILKSAQKDTSRIWNDFIQQIKDRSSIEAALKAEYNHEYTSDIGESVVEKVNLAQDVKDYSFVEEWYYDNKTFSIQKKVNAIAPIILVSVPDSKTNKKIFKGYSMPFFYSM